MLGFGVTRCNPAGAKNCFAEAKIDRPRGFVKSRKRAKYFTSYFGALPYRASHMRTRRWRYRLTQGMHSALEEIRWLPFLASTAFAYLQFFYADVFMQIAASSPLLVFVLVGGALPPV
jgi:hypothetical protein